MKVQIFKSLSEKELKTIEEISTLLRKKKGDILFFEGDDPVCLYFLVDGVVKLFKTVAFNGKEITLNYILPNSFIGEFAVIKNIPFPFSAEMETEGEVLKINASEFKSLMLKNHKLSLEFVNYLANKIEKNYEYCENLMEKNVRKKIAKFLAEHEDLFFKLNKNKIASILNIAPETFSRILKEMKDEGLIIERTVIKINKDKLKEILEE